MVVLAGAITTKAGKVLLSRQHVDMSRIRIEGLLAAFPKLIGTEKEHTYVETDTVRYVYQPVETLYVLLITTKKSNIVEDLETLRLMGSILPQYSPRYGVVDEESVSEAAFEIIFSFDEVIDWGGWRENINLSQIDTFTEMYSHEERLATMIKESKMNEAKEEMKRKAEAISKTKDTGDGLGRFGNEIGKFMHSSGLGGLATDLGFSSKQQVNPETYANRGGISSDAYSQGGGLGESEGGAYAAAASAASGGLGMGMAVGRVGSASSSFAPPSSSYGAPQSNTPMTMGSSGKGMALGKAKKQDSLLDAMRAEGEMVDSLPVSRKKGGSAAASAAATPYAPPQEAVHLSTTEKLTLVVNRDGGIQNLEVKGELMLRITDATKGNIRVKMNVGDREAVRLSTHPNIDKNLFANEDTLGLKDPRKAFPSGTPVGVLKWRLHTKDENMAPLQITCWPSESSEGSQVNLEYELVHAKELRDVVVTVPVNAGGVPPQVSECDSGEFEYNSRTQAVQWKIPIIDQSTSQGSMEFLCSEMDPAAFFPVSVSFMSKQTYAPLSPAGIFAVASGEPVNFSQDVSLTAEEFSIV